MKIVDIEKMLKDDLHVDEDSITSASLNTATLHSKWMKMMTDQGYKVHKLNQKLHKLKQAKWRLYTGRGSAQDNLKYGCNEILKNKGEVEIWLAADDDIQQLEDDIYKSEMIYNRLSEAVKAIQFRHMNIKNAIEWEKLKNGLV